MESPQPLRSISAWGWPAPTFCGVYYCLINLLSVSAMNSVFNSILCSRSPEPGYLCPPVTCPLLICPHESLIFDGHKSGLCTSWSTCLLGDSWFHFLPDNFIQDQSQSMRNILITLTPKSREFFLFSLFKDLSLSLSHFV